MLAGNFGEKLHSQTIGIFKLLLPVYDETMVYYPIETFMEVGVKDILSSQVLRTFLLSLAFGEFFDANRKCYAVENKQSEKLLFNSWPIYVFQGVSDLKEASLNQIYFEKDKLQVQILGIDFLWFDTNTFDSLQVLNSYIQKTGIGK